ncbi:MAG: dienelactone hydrolase family protein [Nakamurella sp.]
MSDQLAAQVEYLAVPVSTADRPGPWPGVVLIHDLFGVGDDMREQADWLAAAGYLVAVPDLYDGRSMVRCIRSMFSQLASHRGSVFEKVKTARAVLAADERCTGTVGAIGFCMGGGFALLMASEPGWSGMSVNYGMIPDDAAEVLAGGCPIVAGYGAKDREIPQGAAKLSAALDAAGVVADVKEYRRSATAS